MELRSSKQSDEDKMRDRVYACMETGNAGQARTLMAELLDVDLVLYSSIRTAIVREYGVLL